ncbi:hypothetical protein EPO56_00065 [Patescibacteria group bacterium]|nr:MAG: hypothetical protein EPO56_00065 [Patescibacteria group bacterium]
MKKIFKRKQRYQVIEPDEILIDAANIPDFDTTRLEGRLERPVSVDVFKSLYVLIFIIGAVFFYTLFQLQVVKYTSLSARAESNRLASSLIVAERGLLLDRNGVPLAENTSNTSSGGASTTLRVASTTRSYSLGAAASALVGYVSYPKVDQNGFWYQEETKGIVGAEALYDAELSGENGISLAETNASGKIVSGSIVRTAKSGQDIKLSIDAGIQKSLYDAIRARAEMYKWRGGSGVIMDIKTGELYAMVSYPSFDPGVMSLGEPRSAVNAILNDTRAPLLDRAVSGLYTPGSVVKPFVALAALQEKIISPNKQILSTGSISVPNPYDPSKPSVFKDWKAHGLVDMRQALAVSSDVYFYEVGGGFKDQRGLGIGAIEKYMRLFGFGSSTNMPLPGEEIGVIPNPEWKANVFDGERWFLGNTYHTAIGQYGFQVTVMQLVRAVSALVNGGTLVTPVIRTGEQGLREPISITTENTAIVMEGMRMAVTEGTARALEVPGIKVGAKTGTAETGARKEFINSVLIGFYPYEKPRYAFAIVMERAPAGTGQGAPAVMGDVLRWIVENRPEMTK